MENFAIYPESSNVTLILKQACTGTLQSRVQGLSGSGYFRVRVPQGLNVYRDKSSPEQKRRGFLTSFEMTDGKRICLFLSLRACIVYRYGSLSIFILNTVRNDDSLLCHPGLVPCLSP